jgi:hypothetical protein
MLIDALFTSSMPPTIQAVKHYFSQKGIPAREAEVFFHFHDKRQWKSKKGNFFKSWKAPARTWIATCQAMSKISLQEKLSEEYRQSQQSLFK